MKKSRFTDSQMIEALKRAEALPKKWGSHLADARWHNEPYSSEGYRFGLFAKPSRLARSAIAARPGVASKTMKLPIGCSG